MNKHDAIEFVPLINALAEGKTIQVKMLHSGEWLDSTGNLAFDGPREEYRVKPEPKEYWFNRYESHEAGPYDSKESAANHGGNTATQVRYREVME